MGGFGTFPEVQQYQDIIMYILYPRFMPLLFLLAGISARYALQKHSGKEWFKARSRKLLVPATIWLLLFQWITWYFNTQISSIAQETDLTVGMPWIVKYFIWALSGTWPLWFIQLLWILCLVLLIIRKIDIKDKFWNRCGKANIVVILLLGMLFRLGEQTLITDLTNPFVGLLNLYKPIFYWIIFLLGYFVFSHDEVQEKVKKAWIPLLVCSVILGGVLIITTWGQNNTSPQYLGSWWCCLYGWLSCLALMGWFNARFDKTNKFSQYMTRSSFGIYVIHYLVIASLGYMMRRYTSLNPLVIYAILTVAVFTLSPLLYELIRRIPFMRWCVFWEKKK